jgi:hypothetical protein
MGNLSRRPASFPRPRTRHRATHHRVRQAVAKQRDVHRAIAAWYALEQAPVRDRLAELLAAYSPRPGETTMSVVARMAVRDQAEAVDLAAVIEPVGDAARRRRMAGGTFWP